MFGADGERERYGSEKSRGEEAGEVVVAGVVVDVKQLSKVKSEC